MRWRWQRRYGRYPTTTEPTGPTPAEQIAELQAQINALRAELGQDPIDIDDLTGSVADLTQQVSDLRQQVQDAKDAADAAADKENKATAAKLYAGINAPAGDGTGNDDFHADYNDADQPNAGDAVDTRIMVTIGAGDAPGTAVALSEDKKTTVGMNHGWTGKRYADPAGGDSYEAIVYSNVAAPTMGKKFGSADAVTPTGDYQYQLTDGALPSAQFVAANVAFTGVTRTAGTETFKLPDPNPSGADVILIPGTYHGVSGTYNCTPATPADGCSAAVAAKGFTVSAGDTWTFTPSDAMARVRDAADTAYASYGWWLMKTENGKTFTASAFHDVKGAVADAAGLDTLNGTATYMGGAAGKYALASSTGGTNDAGHFTARAMLEANFTDNMISGTIDMFMGADGMARDWSVELKEAAVGATGVITRAAADDTVWTIGGTAAAASGEWSGSLRDNGTDGVPKVATGTFYTEYGTAGRMVGGFGANKQ